MVHAGLGGSYDGTGDLGRILRVHLFLKTLAQQVQARGLGNPATDNALVSAIAPNLTTDDGLSGLTLVKLAFDYRQAKIGTAPELTLPTINDAATYYYEGAPYGDVIFPSEPQDQQAIDQFLGTTPSGWKLAPSSISVSVIDGTNSATNTASVAARARQARLPHGADEGQPLRRSRRRDDRPLRRPNPSRTGGKGDVLALRGRGPRTGDAGWRRRRECRHRLDPLGRSTDDACDGRVQFPNGHRQLGRELGHRGREFECGAAADQQPEYRGADLGEPHHPAVGRSLVPQGPRISEGGAREPRSLNSGRTTFACVGICLAKRSDPTGRRQTSTHTST